LDISIKQLKIKIMKKRIVFMVLIAFCLTGFSQVKQGLFRTVNQDMFMKRTISDINTPNPKVTTTYTINPVSWIVRLDATMAVKEINYNKVTGESKITEASFIGPAIGFQHFVPTSTTDGTPYNNYGASLGLALGKTIFQPNLAEAKAVLAFNLFQYFKFGGTYTFNPPTDIRHLGYFIGGGITFGARFN
jgi:hypothetical protein